MVVLLCLPFIWTVQRTVHATDAPVAGTAAENIGFGIEELTTLLTRETAASANFREQQFRHVLKEPLRREGELYFEPPALFEKRVLAPVSETYRLEGETLSIVLPGRRTRQVSLRNQPLLGGLLLGFQAVVSGRLDRLEPAFVVTVSGTAEDWQLVLRPNQEEIATYIDVIQVTGRGSEPLRFEITERNGDRTVTDIEPK